MKDKTLEINKKLIAVYDAKQRNLTQQKARLTKETIDYLKKLIDDYGEFLDERGLLDEFTEWQNADATTEQKESNDGLV